MISTARQIEQVDNARDYWWIESRVSDRIVITTATGQRPIRVPERPVPTLPVTGIPSNRPNAVGS
jgi:hypothetical protein